MINKRKQISALVITVMMASIFALPILNNDVVDAAAKKVKVTYKINGGKFSAKKYKNKKSYTKKLNKGKKVGSLPKGKRTGYSFKGWYTKKSGGKKVNGKTKIKKNTILYAHWKVKNYTVTFNARNGSSPVSKKVKFNQSYNSVLSTPKFPGNKFVGWYTSSKGGEKYTKQNKTGNTTLYGHWEITDKLGMDSDLFDLFGETPQKIASKYEVIFVGRKSYKGKNYDYYSNVFNDIIFIFQDGKCIMISVGFDQFFPKLNNRPVLNSELAKIYGKGFCYPDGTATEYNIGEIYFCTINQLNSDTVECCIISAIPLELIREIEMS